MRRQSPNPTIRSPRPRRGATLVEAAFVLSFLILVLTTIVDLGLAVLNFNTLSSAARRTAREATVHGERAAPKRTVWGPNSYNATAADSTEPAATVRASLATIEPGDVNVEIEWPDGGNRNDQHVRVTLRYRHKSIVPLPFADYYDLSAVSTMRIAH